MCFTTEANGDRAKGWLCDMATANGTLTSLAYDDPRSPFNGVRRQVDINSNRIQNADGPEVWYTDPFGKNGRTDPFPGSDSPGRGQDGQRRWLFLPGTDAGRRPGLRWAGGARTELGGEGRKYLDPRAARGGHSSAPHRAQVRRGSPASASPPYSPSIILYPTPGSVRRYSGLAGSRSILARNCAMYTRR